MDVERSRQERLIRRLAQRLAMLEAQAPAKLDPSDSSPPLSSSEPPGAI